MLSPLQAEQEDDAANVAAAMAVLRQLYGDAIPEPTVAHVSRWGSDPYSRGESFHV
jgi:polyamine oxidase